MVLVMSAACFSWLLTINNIPELLTGILLDVIHSKATFLVGVVCLLTFLGMFMDVSTIILIIAPLLVPTANYFNIDPSISA